MGINEKLVGKKIKTTYIKKKNKKMQRWDDVVLFIRPTRTDLCLIKELEVFGHASGLNTNMQKSSLTPIGWSDDELAVIAEVIPCQIKEFPCTYLGLHLTIRKPTKTDIQPINDKVVDSLLGWKASLMNEVGHLITVCVVLTSIPIYLMISMDLRKWVIKAIDK